MNDVSVVVCAKDSGHLLRRCLESVRANDAAQVIVVDGRSTDDTLAVGQEYADVVLNDEGKGLAYARNLGASAATSHHVAFVGPDNILPPATLRAMIDALARNGWSGASAQTRLLQPGGYLARCLDRYKGYRFTPGQRSAIGTPTLFATDVLRQFMFDPSLTSSDDADLCERMVGAGHRLGIVPVTVFEQGSESLGSVMTRWRWYGESDAQFYAKHAGGWSAVRKLKSISHPLRGELLRPGLRAVRSCDLAILPFLLLITVVRYLGWCEHRRIMRSQRG